jgi:ComF family protein
VKALPINGPPVCARCGRELPGAFDTVMPCAACRLGVSAFDMARAPWTYAGPMRDAVRQFKYHRRWRIGRWLAGEMASTARRHFPIDELDAVLPVPPHWTKRVARGFNPVGDLARTVSDALGKPCLSSALRRTRWTKTQTRLPSSARARNVAGAFAASAAKTRGRTLLLIDDVLTSGATADACAKALKAAGASRVFVLTAAQTPAK